MSRPTDQPGGAESVLRDAAADWQLPAGSVHVWSLPLSEAHAAEFRPSLSPDELARADRFVFARDSVRFVAARGWLRRILAGYVDGGAAELRFSYGICGKPELASESARSGVTFNLSHSGDAALVAVASGFPVGVDLEGMRPDIDVNLVARSFFSPRECGELDGLPAADRRAAFYRCWVRKEAYLKGLGVGVTRGLQNFSVSLRPGQAPAVLEDTLAPDAPEKWFLVDLGTDDRFAAGLAIAGKPLILRCFGSAPAECL
jgi:4'-phosphopantetheinyl transferase